VRRWNDISELCEVSNSVSRKCRSQGAIMMSFCDVLYTAAEWE